MEGRGNDAKMQAGEQYGESSAVKNVQGKHDDVYGESSAVKNVQGKHDDDDGYNESSTLARGSPLLSWRAKSTANNSDRATHFYEDTSLSFFASSFDTMSEPDHHAFAVDHTSLLSPARGRSYSTGIDIALPDLKHDAEESDCSLGDISPIKLIYNNGTSLREAKFEDHSLTNYQTIDSGPWSMHNTSYRESIGFSNPFFVLRTSHKAFENVKYLLPCLRGDDLCPVNVSEHNGHIHHYRTQDQASNTSSIDTRMAKRRVETAICAFGGSLNHPIRKQDAQSIFRPKGQISKRQLYEQMLKKRYYLSGSLISWQVEENPPIFIESESDSGDQSSSRALSSNNKNGRMNNAGAFDEQHDRQESGSPRGTWAANHEAPKVKYRCKRCGQLKQNHDCPYRESLQRSIGVMVFPAVNSFTAAEPGTLAPPLTQMNNFVSYDSDQGSPQPEYASRAMPFSNHHPGRSIVLPSAVTPDSLRAVEGISIPDATMNSSLVCSARVPGSSSKGGNRNSKRARSQVETATTAPFQRSPFVASVSLRPEHYRAVSPSAVDEQVATKYQYPSIPLTFSERKHLSDTLFHLSKEIPSVTADCAAILGEARKNNEWDLAVAELLTQVTVGLYCSENDTRLDGLQQYLLGLGVSC